ncbi:MAG: hypothetical protein WCC60_11460, partial [Ilumatobacteraceae bacterium]
HAARHGVYPLRDAGSPRHGDYSVPHSLGGATRMTYTTAHVRMPESSVINLKNCSFRIAANVEVAAGRTDHGVIVCQGGNMAGWSLYLDDECRPTYHYNWFGHEHTSVASPVPLAAGPHEVCVDFAYDGGFGKGGDIVLSVNGGAVAHGRVERTVPIVFSMSGETFDVGIDTGAPVGPYPHHFPCTAKIRGVTLDRLDEPSPEVRRLIAEGEFKASLSTQ